ncbi:MAG: hypothetical protein ACE37E_19185 [Hyphomicrobiales bacterium]
MPQILQVAAIALATAGSGAATLAVVNEDIPDLAVPAGAWTDGGELDGLSFDILGTDLASGAVLEDEIIFRNGTFQSVDCQEYCDFGWSNYQTKMVDDVLHFTVTALCSSAPHTVVWYGTVVDEVINIDVTWTTRRWYWTRQIAIEATGELIPSAENLSAL